MTQQMALEPLPSDTWSICSKSLTWSNQSLPIMLHSRTTIGSANWLDKAIVNLITQNNPTPDYIVEWLLTHHSWCRVHKACLNSNGALLIAMLQFQKWLCITIIEVTRNHKLCVQVAGRKTANLVLGNRHHRKVDVSHLLPIQQIHQSS